MPRGFLEKESGTGGVR